MINGISLCSEVKRSRLFLFDYYLLNVSSNFTKMVAIESQKPGLVKNTIYNNRSNVFILML